MSTHHRLAPWLILGLLTSKLLGAHAAGAAPDAGAAARFVYKAQPGLDLRLATSLRAPNLMDPQDGRRSASTLVDNRLGQSVVFSTPAGDRTLSPGSPGFALVPEGFVNGHLVISLRVGGALGLSGPGASVPAVQIEGRPLPAQSHFAVVPPGGPAIGLATGLDDVNSRIVAARVVAVRGREGDLWAALYLVEQRGFEGVRQTLRVRTHGADGSLSASLDGPAGLNLGLVGYYDGARGAAVLRDGNFWGVAEGRNVDRIKGVVDAWYVDGLDAFCTLEAGAVQRAWGVTDARSGAIVAGGDEARELVLSRVDLDARANARKTVLARVLVPALGPPLDAETARLRSNAMKPLVAYTFDSVSRAASLVFGGMGTRQVLQRMPDSAEEAIARARSEIAAGRPQTETRSFAQPTAKWSALPSRHGATLFVGAVSLPAEKRMLQLSLLVGPDPALPPVALSYQVGESSSVMIGAPQALASFLPGDAGGVIGLHLFGGLPVAAGLQPENPAFLFDPSAGSIAPLPQRPAAAVAVVAAATPASAAAVSASAPASAASEVPASVREAAAVLARQLEAYNAHDIEALMALYADDFRAEILGGRYSQRVRVSGNGDMGTQPTVFTKAMLRRAYEDHFARAPASRLRMTGRKAAAFLKRPERAQVRETRVAAAADAPAPDFERGEAVYEVEGGRIWRAFLSAAP